MTAPSRGLERARKGSDGRIERTDSSLSAAMLESDALADALAASNAGFTADAAALKSDVLLVDWDGEDDPRAPRNWSNAAKLGAVASVSAFTLLSPLSSSAMAPAAGLIARDLGVTNSTEEIALTSIFLLAFAIGPLVFGPISEFAGRVRVIQSANVLYLVFNLVCAFAPNPGAFLAFRFLAGLGGSAPLAVGGGVVSDLFRPEERGRAMSWYALMPLLGPAIGPIAGGYIAEYADYRWVFWATTALCVVVQASGILFLHESYEPVLLDRLALQVSKDSGRPTRTRFQTGDRTWTAVARKVLTRPYLILASSRIVQIFAIYMAGVYGINYLLLTQISTTYRESYGESIGVSSLHYIALACGLWGGAQAGRVLDVVYARLKARNGGKGVPEFRLPLILVSAVCTPAGLIILYAAARARLVTDLASGWASQKRVFWLVPDIGLALTGLGMITVFRVSQTYIMDSCGPAYAASALAATSSLRSFAGFGLPLAGPSMFATLGRGVGCTILAGAMILVSGLVLPIYLFGPAWRSRSRYTNHEGLG